jgi:NitT/TauT family transport system permease protein
MSAVADADALAPAPPPARAPARLPRGLTDAVAVIAVGLVVWQLGTLLLGEQVLPAPTTTFVRFEKIVTSAEFPGHAWETGRAFLSALVLSLLGGLLVGLVLGANRLAGEVAEPVLIAFGSIPKITLYPVILLLFGLGISAKIAFGVIHGIVPVAVFTMGAVRAIRPVYFRAARAMRLGRLRTMRRIVIPAALPEIVSGFRLGFALTLLGTLIGEMFASQRGIGYLLVKAMETNDVATVMALAVFLTIVATAASWVLLAIDRRLHRRTQPG